MAENWISAYTDLKEFISANPALTVGKDVLAIPEELRPEFYRLFKMVSTAFLTEHHPSFLAESSSLSQHYTLIKNEVIDIAGINEIKVAAGLQRFLNDPVADLNWVMSDSLFELLKGNIDLAIFQSVASKSVTGLYDISFRLGYQKWVALSLLSLIKPDKIFDVATEYFDSIAAASERTEGGDCIERVPDPQPTHRIPFEHSTQPTFTVPDVILKYSAANSFVSMRTEPHQSVWVSRFLSDKKEWYPLASLRAKYPQIASWADILLFLAEKPGDLVLVSDYKWLCRPDLIVQCMDRKDWYDQGSLGTLKLYHNLYKPTLGTYVVCREPNPAGVLTSSGRQAEELGENIKSGEQTDEQDPDIHFLVVGFDKLALTPIAKVIAKAFDSIGET
jgi:hypothetical protein